MGSSRPISAGLEPVLFHHPIGAPEDGRWNREAERNYDSHTKVDTWSQGDFVEKGGWAMVPGSKPYEQVSAVAKACALLLAPSA